jgi:ubiquinone/menaquinone biosynthesis C-methylase UbiE
LGQNDAMSTHGQDGHGHHEDRGMRGFLRYMKMLPKMWRSPVSREVVREVSPRPGERVVDVGAGMGPATVPAAKTGASVLAVDPTPYMRRILTVRRLGQRRRTAIRVADGSAESIPADDRSVDAAWTVNTMHHWGDLDAAVHELARVLRPGGRILLVDEDFDAPTHPAFEHMQKRKGHRARHFADIDPAAVAAKLIDSGFVSAEGSTDSMADRPAKVVRAVR